MMVSNSSKASIIRNHLDAKLKPLLMVLKPRVHNISSSKIFKVKYIMTICLLKGNSRTFDDPESKLSNAIVITNSVTSLKL